MTDPGASLSPLSRWRERARAVLRRALSENTTPRGVGLAVALGAFVGTSPLVGFHLVVAAALATPLKLNRALAALATNISVGPLVGVLVLGEVVLGSRLLGRPLPELSMSHAVDIARDAVGAWWLGFAVVGPATAAVLGTLAYGVARWREGRHGSDASA